MISVAGLTSCQSFQFSSGIGEGKSIHLSADLPLPTLYPLGWLKQPELLSCNVKSHVLFKDADIYLINFPPELTQWACIQTACMNNADFKTALLQRMSSSHTVNTNKLPKVLKSRTPVPLLIPTSLWNDAAPPLCARPAAKSLTWSWRMGTDRTISGKKHTTWGFHIPRDSADPKSMSYLYLLLLLLWDRGAVRGRGGPSPFPDYLQSNLRHGKTSERDKHPEEWGKSNKVTLLRRRLLPNLQIICKLFIYKIIKISCPILPYHVSVAGLLVPCRPCSGLIWELWRRWLQGLQLGPTQDMGHTMAWWPECPGDMQLPSPWAWPGLAY